MTEEDKEEKREYHPDPKKLWEEYHRVIAPVVVMKKYDDEQVSNNSNILFNYVRYSTSDTTSTGL